MEFNIIPKKLAANLITSHFYITIMHPSSPVYKILKDDLEYCSNEIISESDQKYIVEAKYFKSAILDAKLEPHQLNDKTYYQLMIDDPQKGHVPYGEWFESFETINEVIYANKFFIPDSWAELAPNLLNTPWVLVKFTDLGLKLFDDILNGLSSTKSVLTFGEDNVSYGLPALILLDKIGHDNPHKYLSGSISILTHIDTHCERIYPIFHSIGENTFSSYESLKRVIFERLFIGDQASIKLEYGLDWFQHHCHKTPICQGGDANVPENPSTELPEITEDMQNLYDDTKAQLERAEQLVDVALDSLHMAGYFNTKCNLLLNMFDTIGARVMGEHNDKFIPITRPLVKEPIMGPTPHKPEPAPDAMHQMQMLRRHPHHRPNPHKPDMSTIGLPRPVCPEPQNTTLYHIFLDRYIHIGSRDDNELRLVCENISKLQEEIRISKDKIGLLYGNLNILERTKPQWDND